MDPKAKAMAMASGAMASSSSSSEEDEELRALFRAERRRAPSAQAAGGESLAALGGGGGRAPAAKAAGESLAALDALLDAAGGGDTGEGGEDGEESQEEFVYDGVTYIRDGFGAVTDPETDQRVGEWEHAAIEWDSEEARVQHETHVDFRPAKRHRSARSKRAAAADDDSVTVAVAAPAAAAVIDCDEAWDAMAADDVNEALRLSMRPRAEVFGAAGSSQNTASNLEVMAHDEALARQLQEEWNHGLHQEASVLSIAEGRGGALISDETIARQLQEELNRGAAQSQHTDASNFRHSHRDPMHNESLPVLQIKFLSYNLWFDESNRAGRMAGVLDIIKQKNVHIIAFQEMIPEFVALLRPTLENLGYRLQLQNDGQDPYFVGLAVRNPLKLANVAFDPFPNSQMGRGLLWGLITGPSGTRPILACSVHLESFAGKGNPGTSQRQDQLHQCLVSMNSAAHRHGVGAAIIMGDMNWNDKTDGEMGTLLQVAKHGSQSTTGGWNVHDIWTDLRPDESGWTYDGKANHMLANNLQARFDRAIFLSRTSIVDAGAKVWKPSSIGLCGKRALPGLQRRLDSGRVLSVLPSDHFGVLGVLKCVDLGIGDGSSSSLPTAHASSADPVNSSSCRQAAGQIQVSIRLVMPGAVLLSGRKRFAIPVLPTNTIGALRRRICDEADVVNVDRVKLILLGAQLEPHGDDRTAGMVGIQEGIEIVAVLPPQPDTVLVRLQVKLVPNASERKAVGGHTEIETQIELGKTVAHLKHTIYADANLTARQQQLTLIHAGQVLKNEHAKLFELGFKQSEQIVAVVSAKPAAAGTSGGFDSGGVAAAAVAARGRAFLQALRFAWDSRSSHQSVQQFCKENPPSTTSGTPDGWIWLLSETPSPTTTSNVCKDEPDYESILAPLRDANRRGRPRKKHEKDRVIAQLLQAAKLAGQTSGKFILMPHARHADEVWRLVATSFADKKLGYTAKISSADQSASPGGSQQTDRRVICVYVDIFDVSMVTRCAKELFFLNNRLPAGCQPFSGKIKPDIFTTLSLNADNDCKLPVTLSAFYSPALSEEVGEKVRTLLHVQAAEHARDAATGVVAAAQREPVRDLLTQIVGMKHAPAFTSRAEPGHINRSYASRPGELKFTRDELNQHDANAVEVRLDGIRVGFLPKHLCQYLAPAIDSGAVAVSLKMDDGAWQVNSSTLDELRKLQQDPSRVFPLTCNLHLTFKIDAGTEIVSQLAASQLHDGLDSMHK